jgi:hypothetical protein
MVGRLAVLPSADTMSVIVKRSVQRSPRAHTSGHRSAECYQRIRRVRSPEDGLPGVFRGDWVETAYRSTKFLLGLQVPDIIGRRVGASLGDTL